MSVCCWFALFPAATQSFISVGASRRLNYMLAWIPWNGLLIQAEAEVIEMHRGAWLMVVVGAGAANNGRRGNILPAPRPWRQSIKPYDSIRRRPVKLIYQQQTRRLWRSGREPSDCVDLRRWGWATASVWVMSGCRLWLWCCAEIRPRPEPRYSSAEAWHHGFRSVGRSITLQKRSSVLLPLLIFNGIS